MEDVVGLLRIKVKRGINLVSRDSLGSDPFVVVTMAPQKLKTRSVANNCNPQWNDDLTLAIQDRNQPLFLVSHFLPEPSEINQEVFDKDTFTSHDKMGDAEIDIKPFLEVQKMDLGDLSDGTEVHRVKPNRDNCLSEESSIVSINGNIAQDMVLKLKNVESGEIEIQLGWINVP